MMTNTNSDKTMNNQHFVVKRFREPDLEFWGERIASVSSHVPGAQRWREINIYRTDRGRYVTEDIGQSTIPGERPILHASVHVDPEECSVGLRNEKDGRDFLTNLAREALVQAALVEPRIWNGYEQV